MYYTLALPTPTKTIWKWLQPDREISSGARTSTRTKTTFNWRSPIVDFGSRQPNVSYSMVESGDAVEFAKLAEKWKEETLYFSSIDKIINHPSYRSIISMGKRAIPHIFVDLQSEPNHWFHALNVITGEDPIPDHAYGDIDLMAEAWLEWGRGKNYI